MTNWSFASQEFAAQRQVEGTQAHMQGIDRLQRGIGTAYEAFSDQQRLALSAQAQQFNQQMALRQQEMADEENKARIALMEQRWAEGERNLMAAQALQQAGVNEENAQTQIAILRAQRKKAEKEISDLENEPKDHYSTLNKILDMTPEMAAAVGIKVGKGPDGRLQALQMTEQEKAEARSIAARRERANAARIAGESRYADAEQVMGFLESGQWGGGQTQGPQQDPVPVFDESVQWMPEGEQSLAYLVKANLKPSEQEMFGDFYRAAAPFLTPDRLTHYKKMAEANGRSWNKVVYMRQVLELLRSQMGGK